MKGLLVGLVNAGMIAGEDVPDKGKMARDGAIGLAEHVGGDLY